MVIGLGSASLVVQPTPASFQAATTPGPTRSLAQAEADHIAAVLTDTRGRIYGDDGAAERLDIKPTTLQSRMKKLGLDRRDFVRAP